MRDFADRMPAFEALNCAVAGISPDSQESHRKFAEKLGISFPLLSDPDHGFIEACGFWAEKKMYGREYMGVERSTVIADPGGKVLKIFRKVKVAGHADEVLKALKEAAV
ncbi:peroxiredoxin [Aminivibrio sp.]|uniref:peroxiredoxin n=1 Tax=Aminivibrio sp. TaxID=1872489 RepID=UPI001A39E782|nr:peroxiredoxin [Aminivibrio sp.]MBL3540450.1 peroxiredoxin [Aminivibrio sp.]